MTLSTVHPTAVFLLALGRLHYGKAVKGVALVFDYKAPTIVREKPAIVREAMFLGCAVDTPGR